MSAECVLYICIYIYIYIGTCGSRIARVCNFVMADDRRSKLQRLSDFKRSVPHVSGRAFTAILQHVRDIGLPPLVNRKHQVEARDITAYGVTPYGRIQYTHELPAANGAASLKLELVNPLALLYHACLQGGGFSDFFLSRLAQVPPSLQNRWHLIMYSDGITPGDAFRTSNKRKVDVVYFSFLEFGGAALAHEDAWFTLVAKRSVEIAAAAGQLSAVIAKCTKAFFGELHNLEDGGLLLDFPDGSRHMFFASLAISVQDELAHKQTWCCKGASGLRSCMVCIDYAEASSELADFDETGLVRTNILHPRDLRMHTDESLRAVVHRLRDTATDGNLERRETALGFRHDPYSILLDASLYTVIKPISQYMHDWMHVVMLGVFPVCMHLVMEAMRNRFHYNVLDDYMQAWRWPSRVGGSGGTAKHIFDAKHETPSRKNKHFKCSASEALSAVPIIAHFFRQAVLPLAVGAERAAVVVLLALVLVIEMLQNITRCSVLPDDFEAAVSNFMTLYVAAFGWDSMISKFHALLHLCRELRRHGTLVSCWVHERKHKTLKRYAQDHCNGPSYERSVLGEATAHHLWALRQPGAFNFRIGLIEPRNASPHLCATVREALGCNNVLEGFTSRFDVYSTCSRGDVVLVDDNGHLVAGEVWNHLTVDGVHVSVISTWALVERHLHHSTWRVREQPDFWDTERIVANVISSRSGDRVTVLLPRR